MEGLGFKDSIEGFKPIVDVDHFPAIQVSLEEDSSSQSAFSGEL